MKHVFEKTLLVPASAEQIFDWHEAPGALQKLIPPGDPVQVLEHTGGIKDGARVALRIGYPPFALRWVAVHEGYIPGRQFRDRQQSGPFAFWLHTHSFEPAGGDSSTLRDHVEFELPFSPVSDLMLPLVLRKLEKTFAYRHAVMLSAFC
jgi:ligand-binding SRPBCC domain-containing protein